MKKEPEEDETHECQFKAEEPEENIIQKFEEDAEETKQDLNSSTEIESEGSDICPDETPQNSNRHPLLAPNAPSLSQTITIPLRVPGYGGYALTTPKSGNTSFGDDWELLNLLAGSCGHPLLANIKRPYTRENLEKWLANTESFHLGLLGMRTTKERHDALFDFRHPLKRSIPMQMIRYKDILVGHCVLVPGKKAKDTDHITKGREYVKLSFFLSSDHRRRGVLFAALRLLLQIAAMHFGVTMAYAKADTSNIAATSLLFKLMDWSELQRRKTGTTGESTVRIERRDPWSRDSNPRFDIEVRPATQFVWPIGYTRDLIPKNRKILDKHEQKTWHEEWKRGFDLYTSVPNQDMADAVRGTPWDPANVINDASFSRTLLSKSSKTRVSSKSKKESGGKK